ncbi:hydroxyacid oxidase 1 [Lingula anatina]|uniref:(S)-2-hydroxy-acid oxidase n=1 Tax=Lingula anatina TaxID=7574 RepID=A0A1S3HY05_LINAN|nr:hydroxyacid oxidase 1 [Lingula anatina]|eukprot:XP_013390912.1 hydroxyacid oxidase 1 [Lingula anatina]
MADGDSIPVCLDDVEAIALKKMSKNAYDHYRSGADDQQTLGDNRAAFKRYRLRPMFLRRDVSTRDLVTTIQGVPVDFPVGIAPTAVQRMAHPDGEVATARAAASVRSCMILSTYATSTMEAVADATPDGLRWFQLYVFKNQKQTEDLIRRAEQSGYRALVLTIDCYHSGMKRADIRNKFTLPKHLRTENLSDDGKPYDGVCGLGFAPLLWSDVKKLKSFTKLPVVVKGVLTGEDAVRAVESGVDGIMVSNHGGRQLDGVPASIDVLSEVVQAVQGRCEVYLDGGVRSGTDVLKALALGARAVFIGRPALYGLAYNGEAGVKLVLQMLRDELSLAMALAGCASIGDIKRSLVVHESHYLQPKL